MRMPGEQLRQRLNRRVKVQLAVFTSVAVIAAAVMIFGYIRLPDLFGVGHYIVTVQLPQAGGLYKSSNVTYRGTEVGRVSEVRLTDTGVEAVLSLRSDVHIPANLDAQVHSTSGVGEQYVALLPRGGTGPVLKNGDVIPLSRTSVPPNINSLLDAANRGLEAVPRDNVKTLIDESYTAVGGLGPELSRIVNGSTQLAIDARANLDPLVSIIDESKPLLDSQAQTSDAIQAWASHVANITHQLQRQDTSVAGLLHNGAQAAEEARQLVERLQPTLPILLSNLVTLGKVGVTYNAAIEQLLVLFPVVTADFIAATIPNSNSKRPYAGLNLSFNLNINLPPPCTTGYLPATQIRPPTMVDTPERPPEPMYCRIPQDSWLNVRGARNFPCLNKPGKRAPTAAMCESDEEYVPLNDGFNWKGDPNGTLSGQDVPQTPPGAPKSPPPGQPTQFPIAAAFYDPSSGEYVGPDGVTYKEAELAQNAKGKTWQSMLTPPNSN